MKIKKGYALIIILFLLIAAAYFVKNLKGKSSTLNEEAKNFKVEDTTSITKIILSDKRNNKVTLKKTEKGWTVNDKYFARADAMSTLLYTIKMIDVKYPVPKSMKAGVLRIMSGIAIEAQIFAGSSLIKQYYIGHNTQDYEGTFMLLKNLDDDRNYDEPFVCYIPGFQGFLSVRYSADAEDWRSTTIINVVPPMLKSVEYKNMIIPDSSFKIELSDNNFKLINNKNQPESFNPIKVKQYLTYLQNLNANALLTHKEPHLVDSINRIQPFSKLILSFQNNQQREYRFYYKASDAGINSKYGIEYKYDPDILFIQYQDLVTNENETAIIQYYGFGKLFQNILYFK